MRTKLAVMALFLGVAATATANDTSSLRSDLSSWQSRGASIESSRAVNDNCGQCRQPKPCTTCVGAEQCVADANTLASMKKNACISIGGWVDMPLFYTNRDYLLNGNNDYSNTYFSGEAALYIDAKATEDAKLRIKLDLEDSFNGPDNDDLLEEVYFSWTNIACSGLGVAIGKKEVNFGQDKSIGYFNTLVHGNAELFRPASANDKYTGRAGDLNPWSGYQLALPGEVDNQFQVEVSYAFADIARVSATVFQNSYNEATPIFNQFGLASIGSRSQGTVGMAGDKSRDMGFRSFAAKAEITPFEGFNFNASFINLYDRAFKNLNGYKTNSQAVSVGIDYTFSAINLEVFAEYLHGWNWAHVKNNDTDTVQLGLIWGVTDKIDLGLMFEYAQLDQGDRIPSQDVWNYYATAYYKMTGNMKIGLEFMWQRAKDNSWNVYPGGKTRDAYAIGMNTRWVF